MDGKSVVGNFVLGTELGAWVGDVVGEDVCNERVGPWVVRGTNKVGDGVGKEKVGLLVVGNALGVRVWGEKLGVGIGNTVGRLLDSMGLFLEERFDLWLRLESLLSLLVLVDSLLFDLLLSSALVLFSIVVVVLVVGTPVSEP